MGIPKLAAGPIAVTISIAPDESLESNLIVPWTSRLVCGFRVPSARLYTRTLGAFQNPEGKMRQGLRSLPESNRTAFPATRS